MQITVPTRASDKPPTVFRDNGAYCRWVPVLGGRLKLSPYLQASFAPRLFSQPEEGGRLREHSNLGSAL
jgi:hypothetical protein